MKKAGLILSAFVLILALFSCGKEAPYIPSVGEEVTDKVYTPDEAEELDPVKDYTEYHRLKGYYIFKNRFDIYQGTMAITMGDPNKEYREYYDYSTYEGYYDHIVDAVYATTLNIRSVILDGHGSARHERLLAELEEFLSDKTVTALHPKYVASSAAFKNYIDLSWDRVLAEMYSRYEQRVLADQELLELLRENLRFETSIYGVSVGKYATDYIEAKMPAAFKLVWPGDVKLMSEGMDSNTDCRYYEFSCPEGCDVLVITRKESGGICYFEENGKVVPAQKHVRLKNGERFYVHPSFEGFVAAAAITEDGMLGTSTIIEVKSAIPELPETEVVFRSKYLDKAVHEYLGKTETDKINTTELYAITHVYVNGDALYLGTEYPDDAFFNKSEPQKDNDFAFEDMDFFYGLKELAVYNLNVPVLPEGKYLKADRLTVSSCGLKNIEAIKYSVASYVDFSNNSIQDASAFQYANYIKKLYITHNTELTALRLPYQQIDYVRIGYTQVKSWKLEEDAISIGKIY